MLLTAIKRFISRHAGLKRTLVRVLHHFPTLDGWLRSRIHLAEYRSSNLRMDARSLPRDAQIILDRLKCIRSQNDRSK